MQLLWLLIACQLLAYYALNMLEASLLCWHYAQCFTCLLCQKLCWHNGHRPSQKRLLTVVEESWDVVPKTGSKSIHLHGMYCTCIMHTELHTLFEGRGKIHNNMYSCSIQIKIGHLAITIAVHMVGLKLLCKGQQFV